MGFLKAQIRRIEVIVKAFDFFFFSQFLLSIQTNKQGTIDGIVSFVNTQEKIKCVVFCANTHRYVPRGRQNGLKMDLKFELTVSARAHTNICRTKTHCTYHMEKIPEARYYRF